MTYINGSLKIIELIFLGIHDIDTYNNKKYNKY